MVRCSATRTAHRPGDGLYLEEPGEGRKVAGVEQKKNLGLLQIANFGKIPVRPASAWVSLKGPGRKVVLIDLTPIDEDLSWPRSVEPTDGPFLRFNLDGLLEEAPLDQIDRFHVGSLVGDVFRASRRDMKAFRKQLMAYQSRKKGGER